MDARDSLSGSYSTDDDAVGGSTSSYSTEGNTAKVDSFGAANIQSGIQSSFRSTQEIKDQASDKAGEVIDQAKEKTGQVVDQVAGQAKSQLASQKDRAAEGLTSVAQALRQTGRQMRDQQSGDTMPVAQYVDKAAEQIEKVSAFLNEKNMDQMVTEIERYARRQPAVFLGGALVLGLLGARFLKSSAQRGAQMQSGGRSYGYGSYGSDYSSGGYGSGSSAGSTGGYSSSGGYSGSGSYSGGSGRVTGSGASSNADLSMTGSTDLGMGLGTDIDGSYAGGYNDTSAGNAGGQQTYDTQALPTYNRSTGTGGSGGNTES